MGKKSRKIQIGVVGFTADLKYGKRLVRLAEEIGYWIAKKNAILIFGAEKDYDSLSTAACRGAKRAKGLTVGITYGKRRDIFERNVDIVMASGLERGGGREFPLVLSCDVIIAIGGGSGTLNEITTAYQANIPVVVLKGSGGWSDKLAGRYLDDRQRFKIGIAKTPKEAVDKAILIAQRFNKQKNFLFFTAVHGNEKIGVEVMKRIEKEILSSSFSWIIANRKAFKQGKRFINEDLNRLAPGKKSTKQYESKRANELLRIARNYRYVIDLHTTKADSGIFTIVTNPRLENLLLASSLPLEDIVIWASKKSKRAGPLTQFVNCGVEIECGPEASQKIRNQLFEVLKSIIINGVSFDMDSISKKNYYQVYGKITKNELSYKCIRNMKDFKKITLRKETFYPLLVGRDNNVCYKMRKINFFNQFMY
jgi:uncharacterized protein (TIGR00725 family)